MSRLEGVFPMLPTPFSPGGGPDVDALLRLADWAIACGVDGIVFPGMASEVETLKPEERADLVARLGRHVGGRVPFIVGASDPDPARAAARVREGRAAGAVAAMVMAPQPNGADVARHVAFYAEVAAGSDGVKLMLQNAPPPSGAGLGPAAVAEPAGHARDAQHRRVGARMGLSPAIATTGSPCESESIVLRRRPNGNGLSVMSQALRRSR